MKIFCILIFIGAYFSVQALPSNSEELKSLYEDTLNKIINFYAQIDYQVWQEEFKLRAAQTEFSNQTRDEFEEALSEVNDVSLKYITEYEAWIRKAQEAKKDPSKCTQNKNQIEEELPKTAFDNMTTCFETKANASIQDLRTLNETLNNIPGKVLAIQHSLILCNKKDENCINKVAKSLDDVKNLPDLIKQISTQIINTYPAIIKVLETCITEAVTSLDASEKKLTDEGIQCLKNLIGK